MADIEQVAPSEHEAAQALAAARQQRSEACLAEIQAALAKHDCDLIPVIELRGGAQKAGINCVAR